MIFGIWWGFWLLGILIAFAFCRFAYFSWQAFKPLTDEEKWAPAFNEAWNESLKKLADKEKSLPK